MEGKSMSSSKELRESDTKKSNGLAKFGLGLNCASSESVTTIEEGVAFPCEDKDLIRNGDGALHWNSKSSVKFTKSKMQSPLKSGDQSNGNGFSSMFSSPTTDGNDNGLIMLTPNNCNSNGNVFNGRSTCRDVLEREDNSSKNVNEEDHKSRNYYDGKIPTSQSQGKGNEDKDAQGMITSTPEIKVTNNNNANTTATAAMVQKPWDRILQCFNVFKPKKITTGTDSSVSKLKVPELKKNMTESDFFLYELASKSEILDYQDTRLLGNHFPPRAIGYPWELTFSTSTDGFSLSSLYRKMEEIDSPVVFVIEDILGRVFGAILSCTFRVSENFYGNSDTFLFRCRPDFEVFKWSGNNFYFIQGQMDFVSVGSDDGKFGLWLDDNLFIGRTEECSTFGSVPLVEEKDFKIKTVECWTVGSI